jgi:hypothetical protein
MLTAPLDGNHEKAADTILASVKGWVLIEFKRYENQLDSEKRKFKNYDQAELSLSGQDSHHFLVYGVPEYNKVGLKAKTYFSRGEVYVESIIHSDVQYDEFNEYLRRFLSFKETGEGSEGGGLAKNYSHVAGVSGNGTITKCMSLEEYDMTFKLNLTPKKTQQPTHTPKTMGNM